MFYAIDRFEEEWAVLQDDDGNGRQVKRAVLPSHVRQGDVLLETAEGYTIDEAETARRRERARRMEQLLKRKK
ncbi:MAG: DUF3006 domain-containing protein [Clostridiales bacterium]|jgi:hypothetical protein|nr:DUF3006 domain-containing protein [Clostridiales bacterium]